MLDEKYYDSLDHGEDRLDYLKKCIAEADAGKEIGNMLEYRYRYIKESVFHDDAFKALIMFPEFVKLFDQNPDLFDARSFMFVFKWILEDSVEYYQVSTEQTEKYFERFKEYIEKFGYTMRSYYRELYRSLRERDLDKALEAFGQIEKYERTEISDCNACEASTFAIREIKFGSEKKAVRMLNEMLDKNMRCAEVPQCTYGAFAEEFAKRGMYDEAEHYADLFLPMIRGEEVNYFEEISAVMTLKAFTDMDTALSIFSRCAGAYSRLKNPYYKFCFADAARRMLEEIEKHEVPKLRLRLSSDFELHDAEGVYEVAKLREFFRADAEDLAAKFDKRNGTDCFAKRLAFVYPDAPVKKLVLPLHGSVTPEAPAVGVLFTNSQNLPTPGVFAKELFERLGFDKPQLRGNEDGTLFYYSAETADGEEVMYRLIFDEMPDLEEYRTVQRLPDDFMETLSLCTGMLVIIPDTTAPDRYNEMLRLLTFADIMNTDDSPAVLLHSCSKILSSKWVSLVAESKTPPKACDCLRYWLYESAFGEDKVDILTSGLEVYGSHDIIATAVDKEQIDFTIGIMEKIAEELTLKPLLDEGITANSGIVYDDKAFVRFSWQPVRFPDENGEIPEDAKVFAEPILYLTAADLSEGKPKRIAEIKKTEQIKLSPRKHNKITEMDENRCYSLFPKAVAFATENDCKMLVGINAEGVDEDGDPIPSYYYVELAENADKCVVTSVGEGITEVKVGDECGFAPEDVFFFRIEMDGEYYFAEDMYAICD